nr:uncharacterized protein LOC109155798 [Ipomoea trifida]
MASGKETTVASSSMGEGSGGSQKAAEAPPPSSPLPVPQPAPVEDRDEEMAEDKDSPPPVPLMENVTEGDAPPLPLEPVAVQEGGDVVPAGEIAPAGQAPGEIVPADQAAMDFACEICGASPPTFTMEEFAEYQEHLVKPEEEQLLEIEAGRKGGGRREGGARQDVCVTEELDPDEHPEVFWMEEIRKYKEKGDLPDNPAEAAKIQRRSFAGGRSQRWRFPAAHSPALSSPSRRNSSQRRTSGERRGSFLPLTPAVACDDQRSRADEASRKQPTGPTAPSPKPVASSPVSGSTGELSAATRWLQQEESPSSPLPLLARVAASIPPSLSLPPSRFLGSTASRHAAAARGGHWRKPFLPLRRSGARQRHGLVRHLPPFDEHGGVSPSGTTR